MNAKDLRILLEQTDDKLSIFANSETLNKYTFNARELFALISDFLTDEEKLKLFDYSHFSRFGGTIKGGIIGLVSDDNIALEMMCNDDIMNGIQSYQVVDIMKKMSDGVKQQLLHNQEFIEKHQLTDYNLEKIIASLTEDARAETLADADLIKKRLHLGDFQVFNLVNNCSIKSKLAILMKTNYFNRFDIAHILETLDIETLSEFLAEQKEKGVSPYEMTHKLDSEHQKEVVANLENMNLTLSEKMEILATLETDVKQSIDTTNFPKEYKSALSMQMTEYGEKIVFDSERDLEDYRGLDNLISINPEELTKEQKDKFLKLCDICPNLTVINTIGDNITTYNSSVMEYKKAEEWIKSVIDGINPEYSKAQKIAVIDNAIGKKISYSPDFGTEVSSENDCRALWKIISSGYGICGGIAKVEQYMLNRAGIESEVISSGTHTFLKVKDIELLLANGEIVKGNTILDPTWNLTAHRFGAKPDNFCISYEQARKNDIDYEGKDTNCHKNDEQLQDATLNLDEQSLRQLFASVGLADQNGLFPIKDLIKKSILLDELYANQPEQNISNQFLLLKQTCPDFATCQNSSMRILSEVLLDNKNLKFNRCVVDRVYNREDKEKRPVIFVYIDSNELGKKFYFADRDEGQLVGLSQEEFTKQFECYEEDLKNNKRT